MPGKKRCKKAQMAAFVIIGIILLIGAAAFTYVMYIAKKAPTDQYIIKQLPETLDKSSLDILMETCIKKVSDPLLIKIAKYGGTIDPKPNEYRLYNRTHFRYLCEQKPGYTKCVNDILTREGMQDELGQKITSEISFCVGPALKFYEKRGYKIEAGNVNTRVMIGTDDVNIIVTYPLLISKDENRISVSDYSVRFNYPLGKLYDLAMDVINSESSRGYFNQEGWMYNHSVEILIQKHRPYSDIVYRISKYDWSKKTVYIFNFALQGYDRLPELAGLGSIGTSGQMIAPPVAARSNAYDQNLGCCYNKKDGNCFENADKNLCSDRSLEWRRGSCDDSGFICKPLSEDKFDNRTGLCYGRQCMSCMEPTYSDGDNVNDPKTYTGPAKSNGESWCMYEGPAGHGLDAVGSRHYKHICVDGVMLVEECRDYRDEICVEETEKIGGKDMTRAVCRPNRWQDCHLFGNNEAECKDTSKRDCYWSKMQDNFAVGVPSDTPAGPITKYEERHCVPQVPPGLKFWNAMESMQVCGWANNYYECYAPGCFQEWTDFDAAFCAMQGDCGVYINYLGKLPTLSLSNLFPGSGQLPGVAKESAGGGFVSAPNQITRDLFEYVLPNQNNFRIKSYQKVNELPAYPAERNQRQVTPEMFIHSSPNDYSMLGIMAFIQKFMSWGMNKLNHIQDEIWDLLIHDKPIEWDALGVSICNVWMPSTSALDCDKCNNNPYRPCTEYKCRSLGMYCNYEEKDGIGKCSSYETATIGKPVVKFDSQVTPGYTVKKATLPASDTAYVGEEIKEPLKGDYTFQIKTNRETQCMLTLVPGATFGLNPPFPGTPVDYTFSKMHNLTIPYTSSDSLSVMLLPLELINMINLDPDRMWSIFQNMANQIINFIGGVADDCHDCNPWSTDCGDIKLITLSEDDCKRMDDVKNRAQSMFNQVSELWQKTLRPQIEQWLGIAQRNAIDEILRYAAVQHKYHAFIKCRDRGGNENEGDLDFMRFGINPNPIAIPETPDGPPGVKYVLPENWTGQTPENDGKKMVYLFVDQLSECAYSTSDKEFVYMENKFECPKSTYVNSIGGYMCNRSTAFGELSNPAAPIYIKCIDHPEHYETFGFRIEQGTEFSGPSKSEWIKPAAEGEAGTVIIKDPSVINSTMPKIIVPTTSVKFFMNFKRDENDHEKALECRYAPSQDKLESATTTLVDPKTGNAECNNCTAMLAATGIDYYVSCHFRPEKRNSGAAMQYVLKEAGAAGAS